MHPENYAKHVAELQRENDELRTDVELQFAVTILSDDINDDIATLFVAPNLKARCEELGLPCVVDEKLVPGQWAIREPGNVYPDHASG